MFEIEFTNNNIIQFKDGVLTYLTTTLEDNWLDWYNENGIIDFIFMRFNYGTEVDINANNGVDRTELMPFFAQNFAGMTVNEFVQNLIRFVDDLGGFKNNTEV